MKPSFHSLSTFLPFLFNHLRLSSQDTPSFQFSADPESSLYSLGGGPNRKRRLHRYSPTILRFLLMYSLPLVPVYRVVAYQSTSTLAPLFRLPDVMSQYFNTSVYTYVKRCLWTGGERQDRGERELSLQVDRSHEDAIF
jgi:hypothetical protein